jgi:outer membrane receptor protein involved in Fe transport
VKARGQLDASASLRLTSNIALTAEVFNITDAKRVEFESDERVPRRFDVEGRVVQTGVRVTF